MVAGDTERDHLPQVARVPLARYFGPGGGMVHRRRGTAEPILELRGELAQIVEQPGDPAKLGEVQPFQGTGGAIPGPTEVVTQPMPRERAVGGRAMGVVPSVRSGHLGIIRRQTPAVGAGAGMAGRRAFWATVTVWPVHVTELDTNLLRN